MSSTIKEFAKAPSKWDGVKINEAGRLIEAACIPQEKKEAFRNILGLDDRIHVRVGQVMAEHMERQYVQSRYS